jgi:peptidoglycan/xylan/chitin deacetylase (PgdA/CDA1 family)
MSGAALALVGFLFADSVAPEPSRLIDIPRIAVGRVATEEPVVAFTFDACATGEQANSFDRAIFEILKKEQIPTTVFLSGRWIESHRDEARELAAEPWIEIGNHSYSHPKLTTVPVARLLDEITRTEELISQLGRHSVAFRPPAGVWDDRILKAAAGMKLPTVLWDVVSGDANGHVPAPSIIDFVSRNVHAGSIVIFHINGRGPFTKEALPEIILRLRLRGFRFVRLSELLALPGAHPTSSPWIQGHKFKVPSEDTPG